MSASERRALGANVRAARQRKEWSQEELADHCGLHRTYVGGIERGERNVSFENILRIAGALGVVPADLLKGVPSLAPKRAEPHKR